MKKQAFKEPPSFCPICHGKSWGLYCLNRQALCPTCYLKATGAFFADGHIRLVTACPLGHPLTWTPAPNEPDTSLRVGWITCPTCKANACQPEPAQTQESHLPTP